MSLRELSSLNNTACVSVNDRVTFSDDVRETIIKVSVGETPIVARTGRGEVLGEFVRSGVWKANRDGSLQGREVFFQPQPLTRGINPQQSWVVEASRDTVRGTVQKVNLCPTICSSCFYCKEKKCRC